MMVNRVRDYFKSYALHCTWWGVELGHIYENELEDFGCKKTSQYELLMPRRRTTHEDGPLPNPKDFESRQGPDGYRMLPLPRAMNYKEISQWFGLPRILFKEYNIFIRQLTPFGEGQSHEVFEPCEPEFLPIACYKMKPISWKVRYLPKGTYVPIPEGQLWEEQISLVLFSYDPSHDEMDEMDDGCAERCEMPTCTGIPTRASEEDRVTVLDVAHVNLPMHLINKILIMRPTHPIAAMLKEIDVWSIYREAVELWSKLYSKDVYEDFFQSGGNDSNNDRERSRYHHYCVYCYMKGLIPRHGFYDTCPTDTLFLWSWSKKEGFHYHTRSLTELSHS
jgi:hypothetical protein